MAELQAELKALQARLDSTQELVRHLDEDRDLLLAALERMRPGGDVLASAWAKEDKPRGAGGQC